MAVSQVTDPQVRIDPGTAIGAVSLTVRDLARARSFYAQLLGMVASEVDESSVEFANASGDVLLRLHGSPQAPPRNPRQTGLFHLALLYPSRRDLAVALMRLVSARWPIAGASDHLVSEAIYLSDPEGNGIELYADRARDGWERTPDGQIRMETLPLDIDNLLRELELEPEAAEGRDLTMAPHTRMGHVHLQVSDLAPAEEFYVQLLGFEVMSRWRGQALFVSAGGYHHHIGMNTWNSRGGETPPAGGVGLRLFEVLLPGERAFEETVGRLSAAGVPFETVPVAGSAVPDTGALVRDPSGNGVLLRTPR